MNIGKVSLTVATITLVMVCASTSARAWGCVAESDEGSSGYSTNYDRKRAAEKRALAECVKRTSTDGWCEVTECNQDW
jgi:hypothetical protein